MNKKFLTGLLAVCLLIGSLGVGKMVSHASTQNEILIELSDSSIKAGGKTLSSNTEGAVSIGEDIIYYESGKDSSYGEGTEDDAHSKEEADKHTVVTISQPGTYRIKGTLSYGQIAVNLGTEASSSPDAKVHLILDGVNISNTVAPAVIFYNVWESENSEDTGALVTLADDSTNIISGSYVARIYKEGTTSKLHKYDAAFYSKMSMIIQGQEKGNGSMVIDAKNEGLGSEMHLTINGGDIKITSMDDGINANEDGVSKITINGGNLYVNGGNGSEGDGIDSNGYLYINGGNVTAIGNGKTGDGGIDADMDIVLNGGTVVALGSRNDAISSSSSQHYIDARFQSVQKAAAAIKITDSENLELLNYVSEKDFQSLIFSSPELKKEKSYDIYFNDVKQEYSGNMAFGGMMRRNGFENISIPEGLDEWMNSESIPEDIKTWIESVKDAIEKSQSMERPDGFQPSNTTPDMNGPFPPVAPSAGSEVKTN